MHLRKLPEKVYFGTLRQSSTPKIQREGIFLEASFKCCIPYLIVIMVVGVVLVVVVNRVVELIVVVSVVAEGKLVVFNIPVTRVSDVVKWGRLYLIL